MKRLPRLVRPAIRTATRTVTYTRWLHLFVGAVAAPVVGLVYPGLDGSGGSQWLLLVTPLPLLAIAALVPGTRVAETMQVQLLVFPRPSGPHDRPDLGISRTPSASWGDRWRVFVWLTSRLWLGFGVTAITINGLALALGMLTPYLWTRFGYAPPLLPGRWTWWFTPLGLVTVPALLALTSGAGALMAALAPRLLGPSPAERFAELEERTERLQERTRLARELHDTIGHALTIAVVQAGAARAAGTPEFTDRALAAIESTGREALSELDRVLRLLREDADPAGQRLTLAHAERLLESARGAGAAVTAETEGDVDALPAPVSREGYRMLQECLTNVLRHAGSVPVTVRIEIRDGRLELEVRNKLSAESPDFRDGGSGLRGLRERARLLGGVAEYGPDGGEWRVHVSLPLR
ncbi:sensor histidine kinase [Streptomyces sp. NPDC058653]|uniref:sensor histidine kinase n=1 Tax=Streptomyces sp. NPDC058653 TaxID=3346576 RepID=UPI00365038E3